MPLMNGPGKDPREPSQGPEAPNMRDQGFEELRRKERIVGREMSMREIRIAIRNPQLPTIT
jgi:hypothetical protein